MGELLQLALPNLPERASWSNINPKKLVKEIYSKFEIGTMMNFFNRVSFFFFYKIVNFFRQVLKKGI